MHDNDGSGRDDDGNGEHPRKRIEDLPPQEEPPSAAYSHHVEVALLLSSALFFLLYLAPCFLRLHLLPQESAELEGGIETKVDRDNTFAQCESESKERRKKMGRVEMQGKREEKRPLYREE